MQNMSATSQNSGGNTMDQAQSGHANGNDWREEVFQKIKSMKDMYFSDMNDMSQKIAAKLQQYDSLQQPKTEQLEKLKLFKAMLDRAIALLQLNKSNIVIGHKDKLPFYEKQIVSIFSSNSSRKPVSSLQQGLLPQPHIQSMQQPQSQIYQVQSHTTETGHANGNDWKGEVYQRHLISQNIQNSSGVQRSASLSSALPSASSLAQTSVPSVIGQKQNLQNMSATSQNSEGGNIMVQASLDSTAQTGHANGVDWKEEVYQKIKSMKEIYFADLDDVSQKIAVKLQEHDSLQQPKSEKLEKLKLFKALLDRPMEFLQLNKSNIVISHKDKLPLYEKQIVSIVSLNRPRKPVSSLQQGQLQPPHVQSMQQPQSQINPVQSHENQILTKKNKKSHENQLNPQLPSINVLGSIATMQQNNISSLQQNSVSSLSEVPSSTKKNMMNSLQSNSNMDSGQGDSLNSMQQVAIRSLQQNPVSAPQQASIDVSSSENGVNVLQPNTNPLRSNSGILQHQHLKQQKEQQRLQLQQLKLQHQQLQMQVMQQKQRLLQQQQLQQQQQIKQLQQQLQHLLFFLNSFY